VTRERSKNRIFWKCWFGFVWNNQKSS